MEPENLEALAAALVEDPFNTELRARYAGALEAGDQHQAALTQYELLHKSAESSAALQGAARCFLALDRADKAAECYTRARAQPDFTVDERLEGVLARLRPVSRLGVVKGGRGDKVVDISSARPGAVSFNDVAGMDELKKTLRLQIVEPFINPGLFQRFRKKAGGGILLYGPPGCGKTLMARAIATECRASFQSVGISDVLNMWLGESERNLALLFEQARASRPCVLFFDELDALAYSRSKSGSSSARTVVNEFLAQLDGFDFDNSEVLVLAATNMPWDVDPAIKRPGRFARQIFVPPPDQPAREQMFRLKLANVPVGRVDLTALAGSTEHFSGADIDGLIDLAKDSALADILASGNERELEQADFIAALEQMTPSTIDWLKTARNLVKYAGADGTYKDVARYLK
ncbi:MAG: AAA family ATPase, partial [Woeseiaceae bacterium]